MATPAGTRRGAQAAAHSRAEPAPGGGTRVGAPEGRADPLAQGDDQGRRQPRAPARWMPCPLLQVFPAEARRARVDEARARRAAGRGDDAEHAPASSRRSATSSRATTVLAVLDHTLAAALEGRLLECFRRWAPLRRAGAQHAARAPLARRTFRMDARRRARRRAPLRAAAAARALPSWPPTRATTAASSICGSGAATHAIRLMRRGVRRLRALSRTPPRRRRRRAARLRLRGALRGLRVRTRERAAARSPRRSTRGPCARSGARGADGRRERCGGWEARGAGRRAGARGGGAGRPERAARRGGGREPRPARGDEPLGGRRSARDDRGLAAAARRRGGGEAHADEAGTARRKDAALGAAGWQAPGCGSRWRRSTRSRRSSRASARCQRAARGQGERRGRGGGAGDAPGAARRSAGLQARLATLEAKLREQALVKRDAELFELNRAHAAARTLGAAVARSRSARSRSCSGSTRGAKRVAQLAGLQTAVARAAAGRDRKLDDWTRALLPGSPP